MAFFTYKHVARIFLWPRILRKRNLVGNSTEIRKKRRRKQDKWRLSPKQPKLKHTFFIFLFSSLISSGLLSSLNKHKNDCHNVFFINSLFFLPILMVFFFFMGIYRRWRTKCRYQASEQGELTIRCLENALYTCFSNISILIFFPFPVLVLPTTALFL